MNYFDLPEFSTVAPFGSTAASRVATKGNQAHRALTRLAARIHRCAAAPEGYRFVANIAASALTQAVLAVKYTASVEDVRLITPAVDDAGNHVDDVALYVRDQLPDPTTFWAMFHSASETHAA